jgi:MoaA/NifB/PqqE/SkfB family radical SAM enzyme
VGVVGLKEHFDEIARLRRELPDDVYLWVNAYNREPGYYSDDALHFLEGVDPLFPVNDTRHPSRGRSCRTGRSVISVDGAGTIRRCHFVPEAIGNLYEPGFERALVERPCPASTCSCHIGYVHLDHLRLGEVFGRGLLERIPDMPIWRR